MAWAAAITGGALVWLLKAERSGSSARFIAKPLASAGFVGLAVVAGAADSAFGRWMLVALGLSALGDLFLLGARDAHFRGGLGSFLLAHVSFAIAFAVRGLAPRGLVAVLAFAVVAFLALRWLLPHVSGQMRASVVGYAVAISAMGTLAAATAYHQWDWRILLGAGLFIVSDLAVARNRFVAPGFGNRVWGLPLYYGGQLLLAWSAGG